jgi:predicted HicB family RNase H-like nuclease
VAPSQKQINVFLKDKVHTDAKIASVLKKTTLNSFLEKAINDAVERDKNLLKELLR